MTKEVSTQNESTVTSEPAESQGEVTEVAAEQIENNSEYSVESSEVQADSEEQEVETPKDTPRVAAAKRMLARAEKELSEAKKLSIENEDFKEKLRGISDRFGDELRFSRQIRESVQKGSHLEAARAAGIDLRAAMEEFIRSDSEDDRPLTRKELQRIQEENRVSEEQSRRQKEEATRADLRRQEIEFIQIAKGRPGIEKVFSALGKSAEQVVLEVAYQAQAELGQGYAIDELISRTEKKLTERMAIFSAQSSGGLVPSPAKKAAISNKLASQKGSSGTTSKTREDRYKEFFEEFFDKELGKRHGI